MLSRLEGIGARGFFGDMFTHPRNKLDLFGELQSGKVILINTKGALLKKNLEPFGRYFIARLLQAAEERMFLTRGTRLPVYAYIDEADDYIAEEENIEELINKARKQQVALIIANQMESQIKSATVSIALSRMGIQCRGNPPPAGQRVPHWEISIGNGSPIEVTFDMPKMSDADFEAMLNDMRTRFSSNTPKGPTRGSTEYYSANYDLEWTAEISPKLAETGGVKKVHGLAIRIVPGTRNGHRIRLRGKGAMKPDGTFGDAYITFTVRQQSSQAALGSSSEYYEDETDAKPW